MGALLRAGMSPADLFACVSDGPMTPSGAGIARYYVRPSHARKPLHGRTSFRPAAPRYISRLLYCPWSVHPGSLLAALLPSGSTSLEHQAEGFRKLFGARWPEPTLWIPSLCLDTGERTVFGCPEAPPTDVGTAVIASGAVPWWCSPITIAGQRYVDGFFASATSLDLLADAGLDLVLVSSPLSRIPPLRIMQRAVAAKVQRLGTEVFLFEPKGEAAAVMGWRFMDTDKSATVARASFDSTVRYLERPEQRKRVNALAD